MSEIPASLPREERIIDVPEAEREGLTLIGYAESERIAYRTGLYVIHFKRAETVLMTAVTIRNDLLPYRSSMNCPFERQRVSRQRYVQNPVNARTNVTGSRMVFQNATPNPV